MTLALIKLTIAKLTTNMFIIILELQILSSWMDRMGAVRLAAPDAELPSGRVGADSRASERGGVSVVSGGGGPKGVM